MHTKISEVGQVISWHSEKNERKVATGWHTLDTPDFDGNWHMDYFEAVLCSVVWSPIKFRDGVRKESHFLGAMVCALDFDGPETPLEWARETFKKYDVAIGTTKSHQKEKNGITCDRYRVLLWFKEPITELALYKNNMNILIQKYGADKACKDGARFFFPCVEIVESHAGKSVDIVPLPVVCENNAQHYERKKPAHFVIKAVPAPVGQRDKTVFAAACEMLRRGLDPMWQFDTLRIIANGLSDDEIRKCIKNARQ